MHIAHTQSAASLRTSPSSNHFIETVWWERCLETCAIRDRAPSCRHVQREHIILGEIMPSAAGSKVLNCAVESLCKRATQMTFTMPNHVRVRRARNTTQHRLRLRKKKYCAGGGCGVPHRTNIASQARFSEWREWDDGKRVYLAVCLCAKYCSAL